MISSSKSNRCSSAAVAVSAICLVSGMSRSAIAAPDLKEAQLRYGAFHAALAESGFSKADKATCMETDFVTDKSWGLTEACDLSKPSPDTSYEDLECTPECVMYFEKSGPVCEVEEDAAKLKVAKAWESALEGEPMPNAEKKALYAWYQYWLAEDEKADVEGLNADKIVTFLKDEMENGKSGDFLAKFNEAAMTRWASDHKAKFVAKCIKTADVSPAPSTSALSHGMLVSGVIGGVAYAFM